MKRVLLVTTALLLILPDIAMAQQHQRDRPPGAAKPAPGRPGPGARPPARPGGPQIQPPRPGRGGPQIQPPRPHPGVRPPPRPNPGIKPPPRPNPGNGHRPPPRPNPGNGHRPPFRPGTGRPPNFRPIHRPGFQYPHGWAYRRWTIGLLLPQMFLSNNYYFDDYDSLGVGPPPYGYRWVRYGPDLLLVQLGTRRVADVIYGAFY